ncbi:MAG: methyl-accepting chemotaxis protein [Acidaminobacteraceae bacterium]
MSKIKKSKKSISRKISIIISVFVIFICIIVGGTSIFMSRSSMISQVENALSETTDLSSNRISIAVEDRLLILQEVANKEATLDLSVRLESLKNDVERLGYLDLAIVTLGGEANYVLGNKTVDLSEREYVKKALNGEANVSDVLISKVTNTAVLMYAVPITIDGEVIGALIARRDGNALFGLTDDMGYGESGYAYIVNDKGVIVAHPNRDFVLDQFQPIEESKTDETLKPLADVFKKILDNKVGISEYSFNGSNLYVAYTPIEGTNWILANTASKDEVLSSSNKLVNTLLIVVFAIIVIAVVISLVIGRAIAKPILQLTKIVDKQADLDFSAIDPSIFNKISKRQDEIARMAESLKNMSENVRNLVLNVTQTAENVSATSEELTATSEQSESASNEVSKTVEEIANGATSQAENTIEASSALEELSREIDSNLAASSKLDESFNKINEFVESGLKAIELLNKKTKDNGNASSIAFDSILKTNESSSKIGDASSLILSIADQTNLLALNASIEAARAGEHGRGFAVVAEEIRKLAEQSRNTTEIISAMVNDLLSDAGTAVDKMKEAGEIIKEQEKSVKLTEETFDLIANAVKDSDQMVKDIDKSSAEMMQSKELVTSNIEMLSSVAEENAASTQEVAASIQEQSVSAGEITNASEELAEMAQSLQELIQKFTV